MPTEITTKPLAQLPSFMKHKEDQTPQTRLQAHFAEYSLHWLVEALLHNEVPWMQVTSVYQRTKQAMANKI